MQEYVIMDCCPITGFRLISNKQLDRENGRGTVLSSETRAAYYREWNKKNKGRLKEKNRLKYLSKKQQAA